MTTTPLLAAMIAALSLAPSAHAQESDAGAPVRNAPEPVGSLNLDRQAIERGRAVVVGALGADSQPLGTTQRNCMGCHGMEGQGDGSAAFPRLTGQSAWYLYKQLTDYASGARPNPIMSPIAKSLTTAQMEDVAAYYAAQQADYLPPARDYDPLLIQEGGALSAMGSTERQIQACVNCHGPSGTGLPPVYPYLAGQYAGYLQLQLELWQQGVRQNSPLGVMALIARNMTARDIEAVSAYFETVRPEG
jgi:cytochrome c553